MERVKSKLEPLCIQSELTVKEMLERVLRLPAVASKRYLTNKVQQIIINQNDKTIGYVIVSYFLVFYSSGRRG